MLFAPVILLYLLVAAGVVIFVMIWTIMRSRQRGIAAMLRTVGVSAAVVLLTTAAGVVWVLVEWRSPVAVSASDLVGRWVSESSEGTAAIELRSDGSARVEDVPSMAAWSFEWLDDAPDLPETFTGEAAWVPPPSPRVVLTCEDGESISLQWQTVESPTGAMYLEFIAGDPDSPRYFGEFTRTDPDEAHASVRSSEPAC
ncbi:MULTISPECIES: hypothetical protein [unclassified Agromyces]|uniref:hypothetical protein n=1 Tax=unclassified Agromyces TaxID=2639701 RepID=UPI0030155595